LKAKGKASRKNFAVNLKGNDRDVKFQEIEKGIFQEIERTIRRSKERSGDRKNDQEIESLIFQEVKSFNNI
jgi:hypothetical protein